MKIKIAKIDTNIVQKNIEYSFKVFLVKYLIIKGKKRWFY